ncbi:hypothetical protein MferCBS31731_006721 [Microsporum ferrugineum]
MAFYENEPEGVGFHLGRTLCLLCRQIANPGSFVLDLRGNKITMPECELPCIRCLVVPSLKFWTHKLCFDLLRGSYKSNKPTLDDLRKFGDAVKPLYKPLDRENIDIASSWEGLFSCHTRTIIESSFRLNLLKSLPVEIQIMILDFIGPCWYLIVLGETRRLIEVLRNPRKSQCERLSLTKEVYITRITYQGNSYITNISNIPLESQSLDTSTQECLKLPTQVKSLIISTDHVGVRRLQFVDEISHPSADESPWYEIIEPPDSCQELQVIYDGLFIRNMRVPQDKVYDVTRTWSSPYPPKFEPWNTYRVDKGRRLDYVKLDDNSIQGLLYLAHLIKIQTTYGRTATFGPHPPAELRELYEFHPLVKDNDGVISGIFHDGLDPECEQISEFGVTCDRNHRVRATIPQPPFEKYDTPPIPSHGGSPAMTWYLTKAPLEGLLRVRVCRDQEKSHNPCIGLLLYYRCDRVESLGQIRWDRDVSHEAFSPICIRRSSVNGKGYIKDVQRSSECYKANERSDEWQELPQTGSIVWWFGHLGDAINIYND